jgi:hypothetical protein
LNPHQPLYFVFAKRSNIIIIIIIAMSSTIPTIEDFRARMTIERSKQRQELDHIILMIGTNMKQWTQRGDVANAVEVYYNESGTDFAKVRVFIDKSAYDVLQGQGIEYVRAEFLKKSEWFINSPQMTLAQHYFVDVTPSIKK